MSSPRFSESQTIYMKQQFDSLDKDGDGYITVAEFTQSLTEAGRSPDMYDLSKFFLSKDKKIAFSEFLEASQQLGLAGAFTATGKSTANFSTDDSFKLFDINRDGKISSRELKETLTIQGEKPSQNEIEDMIHAADKNKDGLVDKQEFEKMF